MGDLKIFQIDGGKVVELERRSVAVEKSLQAQIEQHMDDLLGVRFLATEHYTGDKHRGRIDSLGLDENGAPVIVEYKRSINENVINQGLFYLDWLLDHKGDFTLLVQGKLGQDAAQEIEWNATRLICIAGDFNRYDEHAVQQINRNIELIRYGHYGDDLLALELVNAKTVDGTTADEKTGNQTNTTATDKVRFRLEQCQQPIKDLYGTLKAYLVALGDDVHVNIARRYFAFKRIKNFACVVPHPQANKITVFANIDPDSVALSHGFTRDMRGKSHHGTGDLEITLKSQDDLKRAETLLVKAYESA